MSVFMWWDIFSQFKTAEYYRDKYYKDGLELISQIFLNYQHPQLTCRSSTIKVVDERSSRLIDTFLKERTVQSVQSISVTHENSTEGLESYHAVVEFNQGGV